MGDMTILPHTITGRIRQKSENYLQRQEASRQADLGRKAQEAFILLRDKLKQAENIKAQQQRTQELSQSREYKLEDVESQRGYETEQDRLKREQDRELLETYTGKGFAPSSVSAGGMTLKAPEEEEPTFEEKEWIKSKVKDESGIINTIEKKIETNNNNFKNDEKAALSYSLNRYNQIKKRQGLPELEFVKLKGGIWGPIGDFWTLQQKAGQGGAINDLLGGGQSNVLGGQAEETGRGQTGNVLRSKQVLPKRITATSPKTGEVIFSDDGGATWYTTGSK